MGMEMGMICLQLLQEYIMNSTWITGDNQLLTRQTDAN